LLLPRIDVDAIVPPSTLTSRHLPPDRLALWVRATLAGLAAGLVVVFTIAWRLDPYDADGSALRGATHQQLGLPPCTFLKQTGIPCPACGMTTSFALLVRGDVLNSLRANWVGTFLACFCLAFIPWAAVGVLRGRTLFVRSLESGLIAVITGLLVLMLLRWGLVVSLLWYNGTLF
jgi:hypothetical protein